MTTRRCECVPPRERSYGRGGSCQSCGRLIDTRYMTSDTTFAKFFTQVGRLPDVTADFVDHCEDRERAGRPIFGHRFLARDNAAEAQEEAADGANYCFMADLRYRRSAGDAAEPGADPELLTAAHHFALAWAALHRYRDAQGG